MQRNNKDRGKDFLVKPVQNDEIIEVINSVADSIKVIETKKESKVTLSTDWNTQPNTSKMSWFPHL